MEPSEEKFFSLQEAQQLLPELKRRVSRLRELRRAMEQKVPHVVKLAKRGRENAGSPMGSSYLMDLMAFQQEWQAFATTGCLLRDLDRGLLDFPSLRDGRRVFLCWAWGEASIDWWHDADSGFAGRQRLSD